MNSRHYRGRYQEKWWFGWYIYDEKDGTEKLILISSLNDGVESAIIPIEKNSAGQCTEFPCVKNGNVQDLYEGDVVNAWLEFDKDEKPRIRKVVFAEGGFYCQNGKDYVPLTRYSRLEIIGNDFENPDLLKN